MKIYYIAGKYRGKTIHETVENIKKAEDIAIRVWQAGHVALCPHKNCALLDGIVSDKTFLLGALHLLNVSDGIVIAKDFQESKGTLKEIDFAIEHNIPIFFEEEF